jgi:hypothetical protein
MASGLRGYAGIRKKHLTFFGGGRGRVKLVSEFGKSCRKGVIVFKGKQFKVVEAIDSR